MKFECINCGKCCLWTDPVNNTCLDSDYWLNAELSDEQKQQLLAERKKYPPADNGCGMVVFEFGKSSCLVEKLFGRGIKPIKCQEFPFGKPEIFCYNYRKYIVKRIYYNIDGCLMVETMDGVKSRLNKQRTWKDN